MTSADHSSYLVPYNLVDAVGDEKEPVRGQTPVAVGGTTIAQCSEPSGVVASKLIAAMLSSELLVSILSDGFSGTALRGRFARGCGGVDK